MPAPTVIFPQSRDDLGREIGRSIEEALRQAGVAQQAAREASAEARARMDEAAQQGSGSLDVGGALALMEAQVTAMNKEIADLTSQLQPDLSRAREEAIREQINSAIERRDNLRESMDQLVTASTPGAAVATTPNVEDVPPQVVTMSIAFFITCAVIAIGIPIARAWGRWLDRRGQQAPTSSDASQRLTQIEQAIEAVAIEVERVSEGQRFTNRVIGEMRGIAAPSPGWAALGREASKVEKEKV